MTAPPAADDPIAAAVAGLPPLKDVIARFDLRADKRFGQHFLLDLNLTARIARAAGDLGHGTTIEVGPGPGGLTRALLAQGARVVAIEKDPRCLAALGDLAAASGDRLTLVQGDALALDPVALAPPPRRIVANLPYNVGTALVVGWLQRMPDFESLTLMFQKEVGDRLAARPGTDAYGRLSVLAQTVAEVAPLFDIGARAFTPPPKVVSTVVRLTPRPHPASADLSRLAAVTAAAFGQRRKMLRSSLKALGVDVQAVLAEAGLADSARAETVDIDGFARLTAAVARRRRD